MSSKRKQHGIHFSLYFFFFVFFLRLNKDRATEGFIQLSEGAGNTMSKLIFMSKNRWTIPLI